MPSLRLQGSQFTLIIQSNILYILANIDGVINTSASLRYTDDEQWEITRGEGLK